jgi:zinc D-Ala-D-Ala carboxypeptidase
MPKFYARWQGVPAADWRWANFTPAEIACPCCGAIQVDEEALDKLQETRQRAGKPLRINSAYRCPKHNAALEGSSPKSQHMRGKAFDVSLSTVTPLELLKAAKLAGFTGIGRYNSFIHLDTGPARTWDERTR